MVNIKIKFYFFTLIFFTVSSLNVFSQTFDKTYTIEWKTKKTIRDSSMSFNVFNFKNAAYNDYSTNLPYFIKKIKLNNSNSNYSVKLVNKVFIAFKDNELKGIKNLDKINENIIVSSKVFDIRKTPYLYIEILPLRKNNGRIEKLTKFSIKLIEKESIKRKVITNSVENSVLKTGKWVKIRIQETGVYKITHSQLSDMGIANPSEVRIFGNATGELPMNVSGNRPDGLQECKLLKKDNSVIFYAKGANRWDFDDTLQRFKHVTNNYSNYSYYFLSSDFDSGTDNNISTINSSTLPKTNTAETFNDFKLHEVDTYNIYHSGRRFYGEIFDIDNEQDFTLTFPNIVENSEASVEVAAAAYTPISSSYTITANGTSSNIIVSQSGRYDKAKRGLTSFNALTGTSDNLTVKVKFNQQSPSWKGWLDYIEINAKRKLKITDNQLLFQNYEVIGDNNITEFRLSNANSSTIIWDVTNPNQPLKINSSLSGSILSYKTETHELKRFVAFEESKCKSVNTDETKVVGNQNLHAVSGETEMIIVTHPKFLNYANELKQIHFDHDNMNVVVVTSTQVFNEFSSGMPDISAIRDFAKMVFDRGTNEKRLKYLLLFGDGSYYNKGVPDTHDNYMLTYESPDAVTQSSYVTDDFFGLLGAGEGEVGGVIKGLLDIGVGRIPVTSTKQASDYINKIKSYLDHKNDGAWRNQLAFVADDGDDHQPDHLVDSDTLTRYITELYPTFNINKIYLGAYKQESTSGGERYPEVNSAIANQIRKGALLINYTGHGGTKGWAHERILTINEIENWNNKDKYPLLVTATCEFTWFDDYTFLSAGERTFLHPEGGAIALFTTSRLAYIGNNARLTKALYSHMFEKENSKKLRFGDIVMRAKNDVDVDKNSRIFFLLGDPALELGYADYNVVTKTINGNPVSTVSDTLKALSKVTVTGEIVDNQGSLISNFNGTVFPTVFDKKQTVKTLGNENIGILSFDVRKNIIFKGKATAKNGKFSYSFIVPKDIMLNVGNGKMSYFATDYTNSYAKGANFDFFVGDFATDYEEDSEGPEIDLFMNNENFVSGGITDKNPKIFAKLQDKSGINTASGAIGHDITAVIDNDSKNSISLNDDYITEADSYSKGSLEHFLFNVETGNHTLKLKAWDVYNNSSEEEIEFLVVEAQQLTIDKLLNYPNPFTTHTDFYFEHNQAGAELDVLIQIFTVSGKLVKTIENTFIADGYRAGPFAWNGTDDYGNLIGKGVYVYRVKLRSETGDVVEKFEKLLILR